MLSRITKASSSSLTSAARTAFVVSRRGLVQPSGADRASVVDVPASYKGENHFTPRSGKYFSTGEDIMQ